jgi:hypothetical protein
MANRREVIQGAAAAALLAKLAPALGAGRLRIPGVVCDERLAASVDFAHELQRQGSLVHVFAGDVTNLWSDTLHYEWQRNPVALAGLTTHGPLFCLERLGWDYGLRLTYRAEHMERRTDVVAHVLNGPQSLSGAMEAVRYAGAKWPAAVADIITRDPTALSQRLPDIYVGSREPTPLDDKPHGREALFSWILAPLKRA